MKKKEVAKFRKEIQALMPQIRKAYEDKTGCPLDREEVPCAVGQWDKCVFGNFFVLPQNTAGSDDYHEFSLLTTFNVKVVFECDVSDYLIAQATIYEKEDPNQAAYFVIEAPWERGYHFLIVVW